MASRGDNISASGQLNFLAAWSSSAKSRLTKMFYPNFVSDYGMTYKCNGAVCTIEQILDKPQMAIAGISQMFYSTEMNLNKPYEIAEETNMMKHALTVSQLISLGYYFQKSGDNMFTVLTYCQYQYLKTGSIFSSACDMTIHATSQQ